MHSLFYTHYCCSDMSFLRLISSWSMRLGVRCLSYGCKHPWSAVTTPTSNHQQCCNKKCCDSGTIHHVIHFQAPILQHCQLFFMRIVIHFQTPILLQQHKTGTTGMPVCYHCFHYCCDFSLYRTERSNEPSHRQQIISRNLYPASDRYLQL